MCESDPRACRVMASHCEWQTPPMPDGELSPPEWVDQIMTQWRSFEPPYVTTTYEENEESAPVIRATVARPTDLVLSGMPQGAKLHVRVVRSGTHHTASRITLRNLAPESTVHLIRDDLTQDPPVTQLLWLEASVRGTVEVANQTPSALPLPVGAADGCTAQLRLLEGPIVLSSELPQSLSVTIAGGTALIEGHRDILKIVGSATLGVSSVSGQAPSIGRVEITDGSTLQLTQRNVPPRIESLIASPAHALVRVDSTARPGDAWPVNRACDLTIECSGNSRFVGLTKVERVEFRGPVQADFSAGGTADMVGFTPTLAGTPIVTAGPGAVLDGLYGAVQIQGAKGAHLAGGKDGIEFLDVTRDGFVEAVLTGFTLPQGLRGRQMLNEMTSTFHLDPHTARLPGWDRRWKWSIGGPRRHIQASQAAKSGTDQPENTPRQLHHDAEFLRELQRLVVEKGAPGSTRSRVGWCAYRLRELKATGTERLVLCVYRLLGYGERPLPAVITWLLVATASAAIVLGGHPDLTLHGGGRLAAEVSRQATGPLAGVLHGGEGDVKHDWEYLLRAAVAVPLVTALLALRNYVKSKPS
jgi:hypothetical protein